MMNDPYASTMLWLGVLADLPINTRITDRAYQQEAIRRVCEAFDVGKRKTLLVMATGTGKTRTAMSLVDLMLPANQARRILFRRRPRRPRHASARRGLQAVHSV